MHLMSPAPRHMNLLPSLLGEARPPQYQLLCEPHSTLCRPLSQDRPLLVALVIPKEGIQLPFAEKAPWALGSAKGDG